VNLRPPLHLSPLEHPVSHVSPTFASKYSRGIVSLAVTLLVLINGALTDGHLTGVEALQAGASLAATIAVVGIPNTVTNPALKTVAQTLAVVLAGIVAALAGPDGITPAVLNNLVIQGLGVWGVYSVTSSAPVRGERPVLAG
jgi:hypothetical protein